jgi:hypothetical protein
MMTVHAFPSAEGTGLESSRENPQPDKFPFHHVRKSEGKHLPKQFTDNLPKQRLLTPDESICGGKRDEQVPYLFIRLVRELLGTNI